jgi:hypothetical protein
LPKGDFQFTSGYREGEPSALPLRLNRDFFDLFDGYDSRRVAALRASSKSQKSNKSQFRQKNKKNPCIIQKLPYLCNAK